MRKEEKEHLTDMLQEISYAYDRGDFWKAWSAMHKELSAMPVDSEEPCRPGTVTKEELALFDRSRIFRCRNEAGETWRFAVDDDRILLYNGKKRSPEQNVSYDAFLAVYSVIGDMDTTSGWRSRIRKAVQYLELSGFWPEVRRVFETILASKMTWKDRRYLSSLSYSAGTENWHVKQTCRDGNSTSVPADPDKVKKYREMYPFVFDGNSVRPVYVGEITKCRFKNINLGGWIRDVCDMRKTISGTKDYRTSQDLYDRAGIIFEYKAQEKKAFYTEEHQKSGTHRCIALNDHVALFCEPVSTRIRA